MWITEAADHPAALVREQPCLLGSLLSGRSVDGVPQESNHGEVSLHGVQSGKTHESRAMNARPRLASARASPSPGSAVRAYATQSGHGTWLFQGSHGGDGTEG
jgi:hypothetical protein